MHFSDENSVEVEELSFFEAWIFDKVGHRYYGSCI